MNLSDEETIQIIKENPYMPYFVGLEEFTSKPVFDSSLFVYIRKRIDVESFNEMSLAVMLEEERIHSGQEATSTHSDDDDVVEDDDSIIDEDGNLHKSSIKLDATCCDVEVKYPTDMDVLNDARDVSERLIDKLCMLSGTGEPRTYRKEARSKFLGIIKKKSKPKKLVRKGIKQQLGYLGRNIQSITGIVSGSSTSLIDQLTKTEKQWIGTIIKVYYRQKGMYDAGSH
ncbi:MAG: transposase [Porphyromonadaceae bacterium]|nr:transposase [Porphyromonadaceae bacterium]